MWTKQPWWPAWFALDRYVYQATPHAVRGAAELRVRAMELSDAGVAAGRRLDDPALAQERLALVAIHCLAEASDRGDLAPLTCQSPLAITRSRPGWTRSAASSPFSS